ncbi:protein of unknown function [Micromonospora chersina]|uniref:DUF4407 domain-containing protein n=2 Tax=Micromonospora chersina TaxID=47854 RepID=A0A1C6U9I3_9ACTN|nr:protein of unknown function [Micromonospora chersina]
MYLLIHTVHGGFTPFALVLVPAWFAFILSFDRLLMIRLSGSQWSSKFRMVAPRVVLAVLFGVILAEPLLLTIFHTAIEERIHTDRATQLSNAESAYQRCNALTPDNRRSGQNDPQCHDYLVSVTADPAAPTDQLRQTKQNLKSLQDTLKADQATYLEMTQRTWRECNGVKGGDVTGIPGVGPECRNFRDQQQAFYNTNQLAQKGEQISKLQEQLPILEQAVRETVERYTQEVAAQTTVELDKLREAQQEIGLLERMAAFDALRAGNVYLTSATWLLRLFLTAIECAPVLVKISSGKNAYDQVLDATLESQRNIALVRIKRAELDTTYGDRLAIEEREQDLKDELHKLRRRDRSRDLQSELDLERAILERAKQLRAPAKQSEGQRN